MELQCIGAFVVGVSSLLICEWINEPRISWVAGVLTGVVMAWIMMSSTILLTSTKWSVMAVRLLTNS